MLLICLHVVLVLEEGCCCHVYMWYLPWKKDVVDLFTCGTCLGGRMLLPCLHVVLVLEGCC